MQKKKLPMRLSMRVKQDRSYRKWRINQAKVNHSHKNRKNQTKKNHQNSQKNQVKKKSHLIQQITKVKKSQVKKSQRMIMVNTTNRLLNLNAKVSQTHKLFTHRRKLLKQKQLASIQHLMDTSLMPKILTVKRGMGTLCLIWTTPTTFQSKTYHLLNKKQLKSF